MISILDGLWQTWSAMRRHGGRASEVDVELEMTSTNDGTFGIDQENPIIAAARERNGKTPSQNDTAAGHVSVDMIVAVNVEVSTPSMSQRREAADAVALEWERQFGSQQFSTERRSQRRSSLSDVVASASLAAAEGESGDVDDTGKRSSLSGLDQVQMGTWLDSGSAAEMAEVVEEVEVEPVWAEVATDDGQTYYHNTVTNETRWTRPGGEVEKVLLTAYAQAEMDGWVREWSETGETTIPKSLKRACKQLKIKKSKLEEWLRLAAASQKRASRATRSELSLMPATTLIKGHKGGIGDTEPSAEI